MGTAMAPGVAHCCTEVAIVECTEIQNQRSQRNYGCELDCRFALTSVLALRGRQPRVLLPLSLLFDGS